MAKCTTDAWPPIGTLTKWMSAIHTRKCSRHMKTQETIPSKVPNGIKWMLTRSRRAWQQFCHLVTLTSTTWQKPSPPPWLVMNDSCSCGSGVCYPCEHNYPPLPQDVWACKILLLVKPNTSSPGPLAVLLLHSPAAKEAFFTRKDIHCDIPIWVPSLLMVLPEIQALRHPTWRQHQNSSTKYFFLPGADWCIMTINSPQTKRQTPKALHPFFCPTKPLLLPV